MSIDRTNNSSFIKQEDKSSVYIKFNSLFLYTLYMEFQMKVTRVLFQIYWFVFCLFHVIEKKRI